MASPVTAGSEAAPDIALMTFLQPFYNLRSDELQGFEALARLRGADGRPELPAGFFVDAAESGRMREIDLRILDEALAHMSSRRRDDAMRGLILSVNLSWESIGHPAVVSDVTRALARHIVPGDRLLLDITTDTFRKMIEPGANALAPVRRLQNHEVTFCLDSFSASDLDILPEAVAAPVDIIKLHPRLVLDAASSPRPLADVAQAVQELGLPVVAAGVETREQLDLVRRLGFEWAQGFLLGEPVEADRALSHPLRLSAL